MQLSEKEIVQMEIRSIVDQFYTNKNLNGNNGLSFFYPVIFIIYLSPVNGESGVNNVLLSFFSVELDDVVKQSILKELQEEKAEKVCVSPYLSIYYIP